MSDVHRTIKGDYRHLLDKAAIEATSAMPWMIQFLTSGGSFVPFAVAKPILKRSNEMLQQPLQTYMSLDEKYVKDAGMEGAMSPWSCGENSVTFYNHIAPQVLALRGKKRKILEGTPDFGVWECGDVRFWVTRGPRGAVEGRRICLRTRLKRKYIAIAGLE